MITKRLLLICLSATVIALLYNSLETTRSVAKTNSKVPLPVLKGEDLEVFPNLGLKNQLAPLNELAFANMAEKETFKKILQALYKNQVTKARELKSGLKNPVALKLVRWYEMRNIDLNHSIAELRTFIDENPGFPSTYRFKAKIERGYIRAEDDAKSAITYFEKNPPETSLGNIAHAEALLKTGETKKAIDLIRKTYQRPSISNWLEKRILANHKDHLRTEDHRIRMDRLFYKRQRSKVAAALRASKHLENHEQLGANFRAAVIQRRIGHARKLLAKLDKKTKNLPGVYYERIRLAKRLKQKTTALNLMKAAKFNKDDIHDPDKWWIERRSMARDAINKNQYETAYILTSKHEHPSVNLYKDAEFLSGWVALRFLDKPKQAVVHFKNFRKAADGPLSRSKSAYWLGRALRTEGKKQAAQESFKDAAREFNTYYGQLATNELETETAVIKIPDPVAITPQTTTTFLERDEIKAIILAHRAENNSIARIFFAHLRYHLKDPGELTLLAELAASLGYNQSTVRIGKTAMAKNIMPMAHYAYPVRFMPNYKPLRSVPEKAIVYSIARQESEFNYEIKSRAGARGLLQVMPNTLKHIARKYKIKWHTSWLTQKPAYNAKVASAYIGDRHDEFGGSYIMTFAGFNAGPGRVRQWVRQFGDPCSGKIDPIDWVERIPFTETRKYVQKVLANLQVYRARLSGGEVVIKSHQDLHRGKF